MGFSVAAASGAVNDDVRPGRALAARRIIAAIVAFGSASANAGPRSEEQLVAYIVDGVVEGKTQAGPCGDAATVKAIAPSPATYQYVCGDGTTYDLVVRKTSACKYSRHYTKNGAVDSDIENLDFGKFQNLLPPDPRLGNRHFFHSLDGFCNRGSGLATPCESLISLDNGRCCAFPDTVPFRNREVAIRRLLKDFCH